MTDLLVVGGGVIGMAVAWTAARAGAAVTVLDPQPGSGATGTAAGMLAPVTELHYGEKELLALNLASARCYPAFVEQLEAASGCDVGYRPAGTLVVAWDGADLAALRDLHDLHRRHGLTGELLSGRELRARDPRLAPATPGGLWVGDDHSVDPQRLHAALLAGATGAGADLRPLRVEAVVPRGVRTADGAVLEADATVLACGAWLRRLDGLPPRVAGAVRPVKGETVTVRTHEPLPAHVVRASVRGRPVYLVPRADGRVVIGATSEDAGYDLRPRSGAVETLLRHAEAVVPELAETEFVGVSASVRPGTPDNAPLLGWLDDGLLVAGGHYRNGVLLAPVTAAVVTALLDGRDPPLPVDAFAPDRFEGVDVSCG